MPVCICVNSCLCAHVCLSTCMCRCLPVVCLSKWIRLCLRDRLSVCVCVCSLCVCLHMLYSVCLSVCLLCVQVLNLCVGLFVPPVAFPGRPSGLFLSLVLFRHSKPTKLSRVVYRVTSKSDSFANRGISYDTLSYKKKF